MEIVELEDICKRFKFKKFSKCSVVHINHGPKIIFLDIIKMVPAMESDR
jgi:hypothetical protein